MDRQAAVIAHRKGHLINYSPGSYCLSHLYPGSLWNDHCDRLPRLTRRIAGGPLFDVAATVKAMVGEQSPEPVLIFDDHSSGNSSRSSLRGTLRLRSVLRPGSRAYLARAVGRQRPRPAKTWCGGARGHAVALPVGLAGRTAWGRRRLRAGLIEEARRAQRPLGERRASADIALVVLRLTTMAGDAAGYEEAIRGPGSRVDRAAGPGADRRLSRPTFATTWRLTPAMLRRVSPSPWILAARVAAD